MIIISVILAIVLWLSISLSNTYYETIDMPLHIASMPDGLALGSEIPDDVRVRLETTGWKLISLYLSDDIAYALDIKGDKGDVQITLENSLGENSWLSSDVNLIEISPPVLNLTIDPIDSVMLPVAVNLDYVQLKQGYVLARDITVQPESIMVYGSRTLIGKHYAIETEPVYNRSLSENINRTLTLQPATGLSYKPNQVNVLIDVQLSVDRTFDNIPVEVLDIPPDRSVLLIPGYASVKVRGGIEVLGKLNESDFSITANYIDILSDTIGSIEPALQLPSNVSLVEFKPKRFRYIVKKF